MDRIENITLQDVNPLVFKDETGPSRIWRTDVTLNRGDVYCIDAASGTGKTSLCSFLFGIRDDYSGKILFNSQNIRELTIDEWCHIRRDNIAYLPQELNIFDELSALDNVMLKNRLTDYKTESEIRQMFEKLHIDNRISALCGRMSVGQRQRVALIRALCQPFDFIFLDEPVSHLDAANNQICAEMVDNEAKRQQAAVVFTSVGNPLALDAIHLSL